MRPLFGIIAALFVPAVAFAASPRLIVSGDPVLVDGVIRGVARERPSVVFVASDAELGVELARSGGELTLVVSVRGQVIETRSLGADVEPAVRLAVLLVVERVDELTSVPPAEDVGTSTISAVPSAAATASIAAPALPVVEESPAFRVEGGAGTLTWGSPFAARLLLSLAALYRPSEDFRAGVRAMGAVCCTINGDAIDADARMAALLLEGRARIPGLSFAWLALSAGIAYEHASARIVGLFDPVAAEPKSQVVGLARLGVLLEVPVSDTVGLALEAGAEAWPNEFSIEVPPFYAMGRSKMTRGRVSAHGALAVTWDLF